MYPHGLPSVGVQDGLKNRFYAIYNDLSPSLAIGEKSVFLGKSRPSILGHLRNFQAHSDFVLLRSIVVGYKNQ